MSKAEYRIETLKASEDKAYLPAQILGGKKILWTTEPMSISECKAFIDRFSQQRWQWILLGIKR